MENRNQKKESEELENAKKQKKVDNQNQTHNVKKEGIGPINQKR